MKDILRVLLISVVVVGWNADGQAQPFANCSFNLSTGQWEAPDGGPCLNTITTAVPFLRITPDARSGAMGDVGVALSPDANAMHHNASRLAFVEHDVSLSATYTPWLRTLGLNDVYLAYLSGYKNIDEFQTIGFGLRYFSLGEINFTDDQANSLGTGRPNEFELSGAYARKLGENFSAAISAKFIFSNLANGQTVEGIQVTAGTAGAADVSLMYRSPIRSGRNESNLALGLAITNIGTKITYTEDIKRDYIPANLALGAAWTYNLDEYNTITFATDVNKLLVPTPCLDNPETPENECDLTGEIGRPDYLEYSGIEGMFRSLGDAPNGLEEELRELMWSFGVEYWYNKQFAVRAGYFSEHRTKGNRKYLTVGLGLKYNVFGMNFSYLVPTTNARNPLDNTLRFSLIFDFDSIED